MRRVTVQVVLRDARLTPGLTPDSIQQKYVASTWITPGRVQFWGEEKRFHTAWTHCGLARSTYLGIDCTAIFETMTHTILAAGGCTNHVLEENPKPNARANGAQGGIRREVDGD